TTGVVELQAEVGRRHIDPLQDRAGGAVDDVRATRVHQGVDVVRIGGLRELDVLSGSGDEHLPDSVRSAHRWVRTSLTLNAAGAAADVGQPAHIAPEARERSGVAGCVRRADAADEGTVRAAHLVDRARASAVLVRSDDKVLLTVAVQVPD